MPNEHTLLVGVSDPRKGPAVDHPSAGFERIAEAVFEMQRRLHALEEENRQLHEALAALRRGVGITVVIEE